MPEVVGAWVMAEAGAQGLETQPDEPGVEPVEIPGVLYWALWVPAFFVLVYIFSRFFGPKVGIPPTNPSEDEPPE